MPLEWQIVSNLMFCLINLSLQHNLPLRSDISCWKVHLVHDLSLLHQHQHNFSSPHLPIFVLILLSSFPLPPPPPQKKRLQWGTAVKSSPFKPSVGHNTSIYICFIQEILPLKFVPFRCIRLQFSQTCWKVNWSGNRGSLQSYMLTYPRLKWESLWAT